MKTARAKAAGLRPFPFELVAGPLREVEKEIRRQADFFEPEVRGYIRYVCDSNGKRIRPALALLTGQATGHPSPGHVRLGVVLEMIHMATLVHDDVIDGADLRRNQPTASSKWGNFLSVLVGDALFAHALMEATRFNDVYLNHAIARASRDVCSGEVIQTQRRFDLNLTRDDYFRIIEMKTAALFAAATELACYLSGCSAETTASLRDFGLKLGTAYQIYDDCIDLVGSEAQIGKTLGTDLKKGKLTLPVLNLLASATPAQRSKLNRLLVQNEPVDVGVLAGIADYAGALESAVQTARDLTAAARNHLVVLPGNAHADALGRIADYLDSLLAACVA